VDPSYAEGGFEGSRETNTGEEETPLGGGPHQTWWHFWQVNHWMSLPTIRVSRMPIVSRH
jgi:hypothetical protein